jgi:hypothetical protein
MSENKPIDPKVLALRDRVDRMIDEHIKPAIRDIHRLSFKHGLGIADFGVVQDRKSIEAKTDRAVRTLYMTLSCEMTQDDVDLIRSAYDVVVARVSRNATAVGKEQQTLEKFTDKPTETEP